LKDFQFKTEIFIAACGG